MHDRQVKPDQVINLCEVKFYRKEFSLTAADAKKLQDKLTIFEESTGTRKQLMLVLLTTFGIRSNQHSLGLVQNVLQLDDLFTP